MARTSYKRSSRPTGRKGPNAVGNLHPNISLIDPRVALRLPENDRRKNNTVIAGLDPAIHKHKALAHDMHVESNALRQSFVPQPMLRSSWPQLVIPVFFLLLCHSRAWHGNPKRDVRLKAEYDGKEKGRT